MALEPWEQELIDLGWEKDEKKTKSKDYVVFHYGKEIKPDFLVLSLYDRDRDAKGDLCLKVVDRKIYKITKSAVSYTSIFVTINTSYGAILGGAMLGEYSIRVGGVEEGHVLCWGTLEKKVENIKKLPDLLKTLHISKMVGFNLSQHKFFEDGLLQLEPCEAIF